MRVKIIVINQLFNQKTGLFCISKYPVVILFLLILQFKAYCGLAKTNPSHINPRITLFNKAASLGNGVSLSWLEQTWNPQALTHKPINDADFVLLKKLAFKSIRLPVAFEYYQDKNVPQEKVFKLIDGVLQQCKRYQFKLIIDYHYGSISDKNSARGTARAIATWLKLCKRYKKESAANLYFEIYNEPPHMDPQRWKDAAYNIVTAIRAADKQRTLLVGASNFNSIYELSRFVRPADENIIYTFHFYEPFFFTHQGAAWVGDQVATTGVSFPYNEKNFPQLNAKAKNTWGETNYRQYPKDGNEQSVDDKLHIVKDWSIRYNVPIICGEYGVYNKYTDADSRYRYIKAVRKSLAKLTIPGILWDYNTNFSIFNGKPSMANLSPGMREAIKQ